MSLPYKKPEARKVSFLCNSPWDLCEPGLLAPPEWKIQQMDHPENDAMQKNETLLHWTKKSFQSPENQCQPNSHRSTDTQHCQGCSVRREPGQLQLWIRCCDFLMALSSLRAWVQLSAKPGMEPAACRGTGIWKGNGCHMEENRPIPNRERDQQGHDALHWWPPQSAKENGSSTSRPQTWAEMFCWPSCGKRNIHLCVVGMQHGTASPKDNLEISKDTTKAVTLWPSKPTFENFSWNLSCLPVHSIRWKADGKCCKWMYQANNTRTHW